MASLELEKDIMDEHLSKINNNNHNNNPPQYRSKDQTKLTNGHVVFTNGNGHSNGFHEDLNDVIDNLTDFTRSEEHRQQRINDYLSSDGGQIYNSSNNHHHHNHHMKNHYIVNSTYNNNHQIHRNNNNDSMCHSIVKRIASESENSSSVSPSLSERSNGFVMWNDQVMIMAT